jgi:hypothetical protein
MTIPERPRLAPVALLLVAAKLLIHLAAGLATPYEFHRDEFLYFAMGTHLRILHMDFPPLIALLSEATRVTLGTSFFAYRIVPAIAGTALLLLTVLIVKELGGKGLAQALAALTLIFCPLFLRPALLYQPVVLDQLWWTLGIYALVRLENTEDPRWWLLLGAAGGLGLLTKFSILFFGFAVLVALLLTPRRRAFLGPWPWIAMALALAIGLPSVIGQVTLGWPVLEQMEGLRRGQLDRITFGEYFGFQVLLGPALALAIAGIVALFLRADLRRYRVAAWIGVTAFVLFAVLKGKPYYLGPVYPALWAAGAVWIDRLARPRVRMALAGATMGIVTAYGFFTLPLGLPVLAPEPMARYAKAIGITAAVQTNWGAILPLPQDYADMLGWKAKAEAVARVVETLTPEEKARAVLYGANYGQAGALDLYGRRLDLPPAISLAGSFTFFGPSDRPGDPLILLGVEPDELSTIQCDSLALAARVLNHWGVPGEQDVPVTICRGPSMTPQELWELVARGRVE